MGLCHPAPNIKALSWLHVTVVWAPALCKGAKSGRRTVMHQQRHCFGESVRSPALQTQPATAELVLSRRNRSLQSL